MVRGVFSIPFDSPPTATFPPSGKDRGPEVGLREYVAGRENALAGHAAAALLAERPGYDPLVLFGPTATGKSLLLRGFAARWRQQRPRARVLACSGADFARAYANALDTDALSDFRNKHRRLALLVLDDLHQLAGKASAQLELSRTLDALRRSKSLFWTASRCAPSQLKEFAAAIVSRLSEGLSVPLQPPAAAARRALLKRLAQQRQVELSPEVIDLLVESCSGKSPLLSTPPQLNHAVVQLELEARLQRRAVDVESARRFLAQQAAEGRPTVRTVIRAVCRHFHLPADQLTGATRRHEAVRARGVAMLLTRRLTNMSLEQVGLHFGRRDHTTVLHACRKTESLLATDVAIAQAVEELMRKLANAAGRN